MGEQCHVLDSLCNWDFSNTGHGATVYQRGAKLVIAPSTTVSTIRAAHEARAMMDVFWLTCHETPPVPGDLCWNPLREHVVLYGVLRLGPHYCNERQGGLSAVGRANLERFRRKSDG